MLHKKTIFILLASVIFLVLIIILLVKVFSSKNKLPYLITLPLQSASSFSDITSLLKNNIKTTITISDKKQELDLFLVPEDYTFFITQQDIFFNANDNSKINKYSKNFYDYEYSSTVKILTKREKSAFTHYSYGRKAQDNFILCEKNLCEENSVNLNQFKFMLVEDPYDKISGGIGLSFKDYYQNDAANLFDELYKGNYIKNKIWYINYDKDDKKNLIIGKMPYQVDTKFNEDDFTFFEVKDNIWELEMINIITGDDNEENYIKEKKLFFSQDSSLIYGPYEYYQKIKSKFFNKNKCSEHMFEYKLTEYLYLTCNSDISLSDFPPLTFDINNNFKFELTKDDLFVKDNQNILFLFITNKEERYSGKWYMGEPFLKKYIPVYNQGESKIGFYKVIIDYKSSYRVIGILGFIFFIICCIILSYLILYLLRKRKNKKIRQAALEMKVEEMNRNLVEKQSENDKA